MALCVPLLVVHTYLGTYLSFRGIDISGIAAHLQRGLASLLYNSHVLHLLTRHWKPGQ